MTVQMTEIEVLAEQSVKEVFRAMMSVEISQEEPAVRDADPKGQIIGSVGFIGDVNGIICLYAGLDFAAIITSKMLGIEVEEVEGNEMVNDAFGELTNMVVGLVKSRLCDGGLPCVLTIPSIVRGQQLSVESSAETSRRVVGFQNLNHHLVVEILLKKSDL